MPVASIKKLKPSSEYDVIVIGSGAAGLSTAFSTAQQGLRVAVPKREVYSPLTIAMYSIDGPTRFTKIWQYESANARAEARGKSVADGVWTPAGGAAFLRPEMKSTMAIPMPFSPLQ